MASKYDPLKTFLMKRLGDVELSYEEIEDILGFELPASAWSPGFWANTSGQTGRAQRHAWGDVGYLATPRKSGVLFRKA
jgi:hypothetical protein